MDTIGATDARLSNVSGIPIQARPRPGFHEVSQPRFHVPVLSYHTGQRKAARLSTISLLKPNETAPDVLAHAAPGQLPTDTLC
jgi:hypothetical protein